MTSSTLHELQKVSGENFCPILSQAKHDDARVGTRRMMTAHDDAICEYEGCAKDIGRFPMMYVTSPYVIRLDELKKLDSHTIIERCLITS